MNHSPLSYRIFSLGDTAITVDFGNRIDEKINEEVVARYQDWVAHPLWGMTEIVPAYSSLTVYYDLLKLKKGTDGSTAFERIKQEIEGRLQQPVRPVEMNSPLVRIPVCYDPAFAPDIIRLAAAKKLTPEELIGLHTAATYKVHMLGFLPGFAYMGGTNERIAMPRKPQPVKVTAGSVGIAGRQTGIYPLDSPGGWHIIGRTPLKMFDPTAKKPVLLEMGDRVQFYTISKNEFLFVQEGLTRHKEEE